MSLSNPKSTAKLFGHPIHPMIVPFPIVFFVSAFVVDLMFLKSGESGWATAATWLLAAGLVTAALAAVAGVTDFVGEPRIRTVRDAWLHMIANVLAVVLEAVNLVLRLGGDADTIGSVGVIISGVVVLILLFSGWKGGELVFRHRVGVANGDQSPLR